MFLKYSFQISNEVSGEHNSLFGISKAFFQELRLSIQEVLIENRVRVKIGKEIEHGTAPKSEKVYFTKSGL